VKLEKGGRVIVSNIFWFYGIGKEQFSGKIRNGERGVREKNVILMPREDCPFKVYGRGGRRKE